MRLVVALTLTLAFVGALGYWEVSRLLSHGIVKQEAAYNRAQAEAMEVATGGSTRQAAIREVDTMIDVTSRPGVRVTVLIDSNFRVVASANDSVIGHRDTDDRRVAAALANGISYAGREADVRHDAKDFEFIMPINLAGHRYALEATYGHAAFDHELGKVRRWIALVVMLGIVGGGGIFYLLGGRSLLRSHRRALERATLDGLTDLGNHLAFQVDIDRAVALAARQGEALALALVDLDDFKFLNDRHGHRHGDELLLRVGTILGQARVSDRAFRIGGDEFALLLPGTDVHGAGVLVRRLQRAFMEADVAVSIGLSTLELGEDAPTLREEADAALGEAKRRGGHAMVVYEDIRGTVAIRTGAKVEALHRLLSERDMTIAFQPIWNLDRGSLLGVEALARPAERYAFDGPAEAFNVAEEIGHVHDLDRLCVEKTLERAGELPDGALLFINISPRTLDLDSEGDGWLVEAIARSEIDSSRVVIEVTERFSGRTASVVKSLQALRAAGLTLALDDVGAGNSGLEMLRQIDVEYVKIDRSVVAGAMSEQGARAVLLAIATYANESNSIVIAEGIEDVDMLGFVSNLEDDLTVARPRIHAGQGYGLGRPDSSMPSPVSDVMLANCSSRAPALA